MSKKIETLGNQLMELTTNEALELKAYLESKGLKMEQQQVVIAKEPEEVVVKESENVTVRLTKTGGVMSLAKAIMAPTGKSASAVKALTESLPAVVFENIPRAQGKAFLSEMANVLDPNMYAFDMIDC